MMRPASVAIECKKRYRPSRSAVLRCRLLLRLAALLRIPIRIADDFWLGASSYETSAKPLLPVERSKWPSQNP